MCTIEESQSEDTDGYGEIDGSDHREAERKQGSWWVRWVYEVFTWDIRVIPTFG